MEREGAGDEAGWRGPVGTSSIEGTRRPSHQRPQRKNRCKVRCEKERQPPVLNQQEKVVTRVKECGKTSKVKLVSRQEGNWGGGPRNERACAEGNQAEWGPTSGCADRISMPQERRCRHPRTTRPPRKVASAKVCVGAVPTETESQPCRRMRSSMAAFACNREVSRWVQKGKGHASVPTRRGARKAASDTEVLTTNRPRSH